MASQGASGNTSRLAQMQMRFQQRQQQEKEQRRIELSGSGNGKEIDDSKSSLGNPKPSNIGNGKVRQMFDERRRGAGIDRSNPLKPIAPSSKAISTPALVQKAKTNKVHGVRSQETVPPPQQQQPTAMRKTSVTKQSTTSTTSRSSRSVANIHGSNELNNNTPRSNANGGDYLDSAKSSHADGDKFINDSNNNPKKNIHNSSAAHTSPPIKLNPVLTKKSPPVRAPTSNATPAVTAKKPSGTAQSVKSENIASARSTNKTHAVKTPPSARSMASPQAPSTPTGPPSEGMVSCRICGRNFNEERIAKHEQVCEKMANRKRKIFDASKHRVKGTDAEQYNRKKPGKAVAAQRSTNYISAAAASGQTIPQKKSTWRQKHEDFIAAIRAAKQVQAHLARGGKLSDLPPPPPSQNLDYVQCPHCGRRFNETAAERHIPRCATMLHNKPKSQGATGNVKRR